MRVELESVLLRLAGDLPATEEDAELVRTGLLFRREGVSIPVDVEPSLIPGTIPDFDPANDC